MNCPVCLDTELLLTFREGIEIDYCPRCRGIWLDRGELDKLIERSLSPEVRSAPPLPPSREQRAYVEDRRRDDDWDDDDRYESRKQPKKRKRESFLSELFDFLD